MNKISITLAPRRFIPFSLLALLCLVVPDATRAQDFEFPQFPEQWINSAPLSAESLRGKGVVLWFFEEDCPACRRKWPEFLETARQYQGKPVMFVAVNSGSTRGDVEKYVREQEIPWPVIADFDRSFEKACGVNEISLRNIFQARVLTPDGKLGPGGGLAAAAERAAKDAEWKIDPVGLPEAVRPAWLNIELGAYAAAAGELRRIRRGSPEVKAAAQKLRDEVNKMIAVDVAAAEKDLNNDKKWPAYKQFYTIGAKYHGFDVPASVKENLKKLNRDEIILTEKRAMKRLDSARAAAQRGGPAARRAVSLLKKLVEDMPESEAAKVARELIANNEAQPQQDSPKNSAQP